MRSLAALLCALVAVAIPAGAQAEKRVALVIGNSAYQNTPELNNPRNDAADITAVLARLGFEVVEGRDLDKRSMERVIRQFGLNLAGADLALFFYAGHGLQVGGQNHLVPTDARLGGEGDVDFEAIPLALVLKQMEREAKTSLILLDACRDNPLSRNLARSMGTRAAQVSQGLAEVKTGVGTLIGFSTQPGNIALDGTGRNSPYAEALLRHAEAQGKDISTVLVSVRNDVLKATGGKQVPWEHTSLTGQVFLSKPGTGEPAVSAVPPTVPAYDKDLELAFWNTVKDSKSPALIETYLQRYPSGTFAGLARVMVTQLKQELAKSTAQPGKAAVLPKGAEPKQQAAPPDDSQTIARALQAQLKRVGCLPGEIDGKWGRDAQEALGQFARFAKVSLPADQPTAVALETVSVQTSRVCPLQCDGDERLVRGKCVAIAKPKSKAARREEEAPARKERPRGKTSESKKGSPSGGGMCWNRFVDRTGSLVPCSDYRAGSKAY